MKQIKKLFFLAATTSLITLELFSGCKINTDSDPKPKAQEPFHTNVFKGSAVITPSDNNSLNIFMNYQNVGIVKNRMTENIRTYDYPDLNGNILATSNEGYYVSDNAAYPYPEYISGICVLPNSQVYIRTSLNDDYYITIKEAESPTELSDLISISSTLPLDEDKYELDTNTNEYVLKGKKSKNIISSGYKAWEILNNDHIIWIRKEFSFTDLYKILTNCTNSEVPAGLNDSEKITKIKEKVTVDFKEQRNFQNIYYYTNNDGELKFLLHASNGYYFHEDDPYPQALYCHLGRISNEYLEYIVVIPAEHCYFKNDEGITSAYGVDFPTIISDTYHNKAELYTNPETGEISYLVY